MIKEGRLQDYKLFASELIAHFEAREPQIIAFNIFTNEEGTEMTSIQVHPDSRSMDSHLKVVDLVLGEDMAQWIKRADFLVLKRIDIYGAPSDALLASNQAVVDSGALARTIMPIHIAGFTRAYR
jgi:hypothetical protein